jgi:hypothetical protein
MSSAVEKLTGLITAGDRYAYPASDLRTAQIEAMNERFQDRVDRIKLLALRAKEADATEISSLDDMVPLLFPHTAYKSYPESFLAEKKWDRLAKWLGTVSSWPISPIETADVVDIDDWIARLEAKGHYLSCSSGTTGKSAMLIASKADMDWSKRENVAAFSWGSGVAPAQDRRIFGLAPVAAVPRNMVIRDALYEAFSLPGDEPFRYPVPPITVGAITGMITLRKAIADGTALPGDIVKFEAVSAERQAAVEAATGISAEALIAARKDKLYVSGMWASLYKIAEAVRAKGYSGADFHPDNTCYVGGGLKGAQLPPNYREYVFETFNISPERVYQMYGMQEIGSSMPRCQKGGRYHVPPWLVPLVLNRDGDRLAGEMKGQVEGRAAFFDLSLDGRWGGVTSGDKVTVDFDACPCGHAGPTVLDTIARYKDLEGDDKISCAGTVDAYVRGLS